MPICVGIAGGTGSGKSSVARALSKRLANRAVLLEHDWYYRDMRHLTPEERAKMDYDYPAALETPLLIQHVEELLAGKAIKAPQYDYAEHLRRAETIVIEPAEVVLVEGIHVLGDEMLRKVMALKVFIDLAADLRFIRRLRRDMADRGRTVNKIVEQYLTQTRPMHDRFVEPAKHHADLVLHGLEIAGDVDILAVEVLKKLGDSRA